MRDLRVARPDTIRTRLEAIRDRHWVEDTGTRWACGQCDEDHPCPDYVDAVAALDLLNNASVEVIQFSDRFTAFRLVPDPERDAK